MKTYKLPRVDHEEPILRTFMLFAQTADAVKKYADAVLYKVGLSSIRLTVLRVLASNGGTMTPSAIAHWTLREPNNITTLADRMRRVGLVKAKPNNKDSRSVNITLTNKGRKLLEEHTPLARGIVDHIMSSISEDDAALLEKLLGVLSQNAETGLIGTRQRGNKKNDP